MKIAHISLSDWGSSCAGMTFEEEGFYWRLTRLMYANDGVFPDNDRDNATLMGIHNIRTYRRLKKRLLTGNKSRKPVIKIVDGHVINSRLLEEIEKAEAAKKTASAYGKAGAEARWRNKRIGQEALPLGESLPEVSPDIHPDKEAIIAPKKRAKSGKIKVSAMATPYSYSILPKEEETRERVFSIEEGRADQGAEKPASAPRAEAFSADVRQAFDAYNAVATRCGLPRASKLSAARAKKIKARLKDYDLDGWMRALANIEQSAFLRGQTDHGFRADLEFVCRPERFERLHDGGYGNGAHAKKSGGASKLSIDQLPPTADESQIAARFEQMLRESPSAQETVAAGKREDLFYGFRTAQLRKAGVREDA